MLKFFYDKIKLLIKDPKYILTTGYLVVKKTFDNWSISKIKKYDLIILDDIFPLKSSLFRFVEFNYYFTQLKTVVYTNGWALPLLNKSNKSLRNLVEEYKVLHPDNELYIFNPHRKIKAKLVYCLFLHNTFNFLNYIEKNKIDFVFTLYPGGGISFSDPVVFQKLETIFNSKYFKGVIVTQKITEDFLINNKLCNPKDIHFIYGVVLSENLNFNIESKSYFKNGKEVMDICFAANKYSERGYDKGFDLFEEVAAHLLDIGLNINFHVIGTFTAEDCENKKVAGLIKFHGILDQSELMNLFKNMDIIISPNRSNVLHKGAFDGFPTGSCLEASLMGALMLVSDELNQNLFYNDEDEIVIIQNRKEVIIEEVIKLYQNPGNAKSMARKGHEKTKIIFSEKNQLLPRIAILKDIINKSA